MTRIRPSQTALAMGGLVVLVAMVVGGRLHKKKTMIRIADQFLNGGHSCADPHFSPSSRFERAKVSYGPHSRVTVSGVVSDPQRQGRAGVEVEMDYFDRQWHLRYIRRCSVPGGLWERFKNYVTSFLP